MPREAHSVNSGSTPEQGQLVEVRRRQWLVSDVAGSAFSTKPPACTTSHHFVSLESIEEDALGEQLRVIWEIEPGARILSRAGLPTPTGLDDPQRLDAFLDAVRWGAATNAEIQNLQSPFRSAISIEDYQLDPLVRALDMPRVNLLIADDVGLGKTIEAGLVIRELLLRYRARSVLVVCPASLQTKWQTEMHDKFGLDFQIVDSDFLRELRRARGINANPWSSYPFLITSMQWLRSEPPMKLMRDVLPPIPGYPRRFDILVIDEAHNIAPSGSGLYTQDSQQTQAIRMIAPHFEHRLFLTATPHNGFRASFTAMLEMLDDQRFARGTEIKQESLSRVMVRRLKSQITDKDGRRLFPDRKLKTLEIDYTDEERRIHRLLGEYTQKRLESTRDAPGRMATHFICMLLKKRLFSSPAAFCTTLEKHMQTVSGRGGSPNRRQPFEERILERLVEQAEDLGQLDSSHEEIQAEALEIASGFFHPFDSGEQSLLKELSAWAQKARNKPDSKADALLAWLGHHIKPRGKWSDDRVVIFTEYLTTQKWLHSLLATNELGDPTRLMTMYGGMDTQTRDRIKAAFQADPRISPVRILIATDTASEGIDLQNHCNKLIHVEIPWNPNVMEQRNGRIDRHGQRQPEVLIWHPVARGYAESPVAGTRPGDLEGDLEFLMVAARKVDAIRHDLGSVGNVIAQQVEEAMLGRRSSLDTGSVEEKAAIQRKHLIPEQRIRDRVERLHARLFETRKNLGLTPERVRRAVETALDLADQPELKPVRVDWAPDGSVFDLPPLRGSWADCEKGLNHPFDINRRRPITFDQTVASGRDDVVLIHLDHRLAQMSLRLLRAELWANDDVKKMHRITAEMLDGTMDPGGPVIVVWSRLLVIGSLSHRLHEEVVFTGGIIEGRRIRRLNQTELSDLLEHRSGIPVPDSAARRLVDSWAAIEDDLVAAVKARSSDRLKILRGTLERRRDQEIAGIREILEELQRAIEHEIEQPDSEQLALWKTQDEMELDRHMGRLRARLASIPSEIEKESRVIADRYSDPRELTFPVAAAFLVPESYIGGAG